MSLETRAKAAATQAQRGLAVVVVPDPVTVVRRTRRRNRTRVSVALATVLVGVAALVVPLVSWVEGDGTPSVVGAPTGPAPPRDGKAFVVAIDSEAVEAADEVGVNLTRLTRSSLAQVGQRLPDLERVVRVEVDPTRIVPEIGIGSRTDPTSGDVFIYVDRDRMTRELLRVWVPALLAREALISVRVRQGPGFGTTLSDRIVASGLADVFAREAFPATPLPPWDQALDDEAERLAWAQAQPLLNQEPPDRDASDALYREWFQGAGAVPRWAGFTLGFELVTAYLDTHGDATAATLVEEPADAILAESGYDPAPPDPDRARCYPDIAQTRELPCGDYEAMFAASALVAEPGKCYVISGFFVLETPCLRAQARG